MLWSENLSQFKTGFTSQPNDPLGSKERNNYSPSYIIVSKESNGVFSTRRDQERNKKGFLGAAQLYTLRKILRFYKTKPLLLRLKSQKFDTSYPKKTKKE